MIDRIDTAVGSVADRADAEAAAVVGIVATAGISPDDLLITLYEVPGENISFGRGLAQRAHVSAQ